MTSNITPQYHVVFDEKFSTISTSIHNESASDVKLWSTLLDDSYDGNEVLDQPSTPSPNEIPPSSQVPEPPAPMDTEFRSENSNVPSQESFPADVTPTPCSEDTTASNHDILQQASVQEDTTTISSTEIPTRTIDSDNISPTETTDPTMSPPFRQTRSGRQIKTPAKLRDFVLFKSRLDFHPQETFPKSL
jgi:hypothetical protein